MFTYQANDEICTLIPGDGVELKTTKKHISYCKSFSNFLEIDEGQSEFYAPDVTFDILQIIIGKNVSTFLIFLGFADLCIKKRVASDEVTSDTPKSECFKHFGWCMEYLSQENICSKIPELINAVDCVEFPLLEKAIYHKIKLMLEKMSPLERLQWLGVPIVKRSPVEQEEFEKRYGWCEKVPSISS
jgi:hypothetical protein